MDAADALTAAAEVGPFFALERWRAGAGWLPLTDLVSRPEVLAERVHAARTAIVRRAGLPPTAVRPRVAASIHFLGVSARLISPALAATVLAGAVPEFTVAGLWWRPVLGGPLPMATGPLTATPCDDPAARLVQTIVSGVVAPVLAAFEESFRVSPKVLWGNVASGLAGALSMLASARPQHAEPAARLVTRMLELEPLRGTGQLVRPDPANSRRFFVRRSCCLFYQVPGAGLCGDCVLTPAQTRHQQWQAALTR